MDRAELWLPWNYCIRMPTIISSVPTDEGFVIGSDGRSCGPSGQVDSDTVRKIFNIDLPGIQLAYGIFGTARISLGTNGAVFDFQKEIPLAIKRARVARTWSYFLSLLARNLTNSLNKAFTGLTSQLDPERGTTLSLGGFYEKVQELGDIRFNYRERAEADSRSYPRGFSFPWGSITLFDSLNAGDPRFAAYAKPTRIGLKTLRDGIDRVHKDILLHYDPEARKLDDRVCPLIGGRVQIGTVTLANGFTWVPGFESVEND